MNQRDPQPATPRTTDHEATMDLVIGYVLLGGVVLSVVLVVAGLAWRWFNTGRLGMDYTLPSTNLFGFLVEEFRQVASAAFRPRLLVSLGIAALLLTPYVRVLASLIFFAFVERNWKYTMFTGFVLAVLTYSLFLR
jgi:uncharacterized membrane protein